jgi:hypothetical protein
MQQYLLLLLRLLSPWLLANSCRAAASCHVRVVDAAAARVE